MKRVVTEHSCPFASKTSLLIRLTHSVTSFDNPVVDGSFLE